MILSRDTNLRCNAIEWLTNNFSMSIDEAIEVLFKHHYNADSVQRSFGISEQDMTRLMI